VGSDAVLKLIVKTICVYNKWNKQQKCANWECVMKLVHVRVKTVPKSIRIVNHSAEMEVVIVTKIAKIASLIVA
jgi:hypothetical protein